MALASKQLKVYKDSAWHVVSAYTAESDVSENYMRVHNGSAWRYIDLSLYPGSNRASNLRIRAESTDFAVMNEALAELPSGFIAGFTSNPGSGWTAIGWTLRFPRGASTPGGTGGGGHTHNVIIPAGTLANATPSKVNAPQPEGGTNQFDRVDSGPTTHNHTYASQEVVSGSQNDEPSYYDIVFYRKD